jgi:NitT/TauT family transport system permease protein
MLNKSGGIGELIWEAKRQSAIDKAFGVLLIIILIGVLQDRLFVSLDKVLFPHKHTQTNQQ